MSAALATELEALAKLEDKVVSLANDELCNFLDSILPRLLLLMEKNELRNRIIEIISHILKRVRSFRAVLPCSQLFSLITPGNSPFSVNFAVIFLELALPNEPMERYNKCVVSWLLSLSNCALFSSFSNSLLSFTPRILPWFDSLNKSEFSNATMGKGLDILLDYLFDISLIQGDILPEGTSGSIKEGLSLQRMLRLMGKNKNVVPIAVRYAIILQCKYAIMRFLRYEDVPGDKFKIYEYVNPAYVMLVLIQLSIDPNTTVSEDSKMMLSGLKTKYFNDNVCALIYKNRMNDAVVDISTFKLNTILYLLIEFELRQRQTIAALDSALFSNLNGNMDRGDLPELLRSEILRILVKDLELEAGSVEVLSVLIQIMEKNYSVQNSEIFRKSITYSKLFWNMFNCSLKGVIEKGLKISAAAFNCCSVFTCAGSCLLLQCLHSSDTAMESVTSGVEVEQSLCRKNVYVAIQYWCEYLGILTENEENVQLLQSVMFESLKNLISCIDCEMSLTGGGNSMELFKSLQSLRLLYSKLFSGRVFEESKMTELIRSLVYSANHRKRILALDWTKLLFKDSVSFYLEILFALSGEQHAMVASAVTLEWDSIFEDLGKEKQCLIGSSASSDDLKLINFTTELVRLLTSVNSISSFIGSDDKDGKKSLLVFRLIALSLQLLYLRGYIKNGTNLLSLTCIEHSIYNSNSYDWFGVIHSIGHAQVHEQCIDISNISGSLKYLGEIYGKAITAGYLPGYIGNITLQFCDIMLFSMLLRVSGVLFFKNILEIVGEIVYLSQPSLFPLRRAIEQKATICVSLIAQQFTGSSGLILEVDENEYAKFLRALEHKFNQFSVDKDSVSKVVASFSLSLLSVAGITMQFNYSRSVEVSQRESKRTKLENDTFYNEIWRIFRLLCTVYVDYKKEDIVSEDKTIILGAAVHSLGLLLSVLRWEEFLSLFSWSCKEKINDLDAFEVSPVGEQFLSTFLKFILTKPQSKLLNLQQMDINLSVQVLDSFKHRNNTMGFQTLFKHLSNALLNGEYLIINLGDIESGKSQWELVHFISKSFVSAVLIMDISTQDVLYAYGKVDVEINVSYDSGLWILLSYIQKLLVFLYDHKSNDNFSTASNDALMDSIERVFQGQVNDNIRLQFKLLIGYLSLSYLSRLAQLLSSNLSISWKIGISSLNCVDEYLYQLLLRFVEFSIILLRDSNVYLQNISCLVLCYVFNISKYVDNLSIFANERKSYSMKVSEEVVLLLTKEKARPAVVGFNEGASSGNLVDGGAPPGALQGLLNFDVNAEGQNAIRGANGNGDLDLMAMLSDVRELTQNAEARPPVPQNSISPTENKKIDQFAAYSSICKVAYRLGGATIVFTVISIIRKSLIPKETNVENSVEKNSPDEFSRSMRSYDELYQTLVGVENSRGGSMDTVNVKKVIPMMFLYKNDPSPTVRAFIEELWDKVVIASGRYESLMMSEKENILKYLISLMNSGVWRERESACRSLEHFLTGLSSVLLLSVLVEIFKKGLRVMDDPRESTRKAGCDLMRVLGGLIMQLCTNSNKNIAESTKALSVVLPLLLDTGLLAGFAEGKGYSLGLLLRILRECRDHQFMKYYTPKLVGVLIESMSALEPQALQYLQFHAGRSSREGEVEDLRIQMSQTSPVKEALQEILSRFDFLSPSTLSPEGTSTPLSQVIVIICDFMGRGIGLATRIAAADCLITLAEKYPIELSKENATGNVFFTLCNVLAGSSVINSKGLSQAFLNAFGSLAKIVHTSVLHTACSRLLERQRSLDVESTIATTSAISDEFYATANCIYQIVNRAGERIQDEDTWVELLSRAYIGTFEDAEQVSTKDYNMLDQDMHNGVSAMGFKATVDHSAQYAKAWKGTWDEGLIHSGTGTKMSALLKITGHLMDNLTRLFGSLSWKKRILALNAFEDMLKTCNLENLMLEKIISLKISNVFDRIQKCNKESNLAKSLPLFELLISNVGHFISVVVDSLSSPMWSGKPKVIETLTIFLLNVVSYVRFQNQAVNARLIYTVEELNDGSLSIIQFESLFDEKSRRNCNSWKFSIGIWCKFLMVELKKHLKVVDIESTNYRIALARAVASIPWQHQCLYWKFGDNEHSENSRSLFAFILSQSIELLELSCSQPVSYSTVKTILDELRARKSLSTSSEDTRTETVEAKKPVRIVKAASKTVAQSAAYNMFGSRYGNISHTSNKATLSKPVSTQKPAVLTTAVSGTVISSPTLSFSYNSDIDGALLVKLLEGVSWGWSFDCINCNGNISVLYLFLWCIYINLSSSRGAVSWVIRRAGMQLLSSILLSGYPWQSTGTDKECFVNLVNEIMTNNSNTVVIECGFAGLGKFDWNSPGIEGVTVANPSMQTTVLQLLSSYLLSVSTKVISESYKSDLLRYFGEVDVLINTGNTGSDSKPQVLIELSSLQNIRKTLLK